MNLSYLHEDIAIKTLSVPSVTGWEQMMRDFLITFADEHEMEHEVDSTGNVYLTKEMLGMENIILASVPTWTLYKVCKENG